MDMLSRIILLGLLVAVGGKAGMAYAAEAPLIRKLGTIDCDMVETTPVVFKGRLLRFEYVRAERYKPNTTGDSYFRFIDVGTGDATPAFAKGYHLGAAHVEGDTVYVHGVDEWGGSRMHVFWSKDLETWEDATAFELPGWKIYNNGVCKGRDGFVMAFEIGEPPEETGVRFTNRFATSKDLIHWELTPSECVYTKERYSACPALRYLDGVYYMIYLEAYPGYYAPHMVRTKDLIAWEDSPFKPIMKHDDLDRRAASDRLTPEQLARIATAKNINNSDVDLCEFEGKTVIVYSWGDQHGVEHLAEAVYDGTEAEFLRGFFPEDGK